MDRKVNDFAFCVPFYRKHGSLSGFSLGGSAIQNGSGAWIGRPAPVATLPVLLVTDFPGTDRMTGLDCIQCAALFSVAHRGFSPKPLSFASSAAGTAATCRPSAAGGN